MVIVPKNYEHTLPVSPGHPSQMFAHNLVE